MGEVIFPPAIFSGSVLLFSPPLPLLDGLALSSRCQGRGGEVSMCLFNECQWRAKCVSTEVRVKSHDDFKNKEWSVTTWRNSRKGRESGWLGGQR